MIRLTESQAAALMTGKKPRAKKEKKPLVAESYPCLIGTDEYPITIIIPLEIVSEANRARGHWAPTYNRKGTQRKTIQKALAKISTFLCLHARAYHERGEPIHIRLTRLAPGELDPANLWSGMKTPEDAIAEWFGATDKPPLWLCEVAQEKSKEYGLKVEIWT